MEYLCILVVALLVLVALGHGLWVVTAWLFRQAAGSRGRVVDLPPCPDCGRPLRSLEHLCRWCGFDPISSPEQARTDLAVTLRQLRRFLAAGTIDQHTFDHLREHILAEQRWLRRAEAAPIREAVTAPMVAEPITQPVVLELHEPARPPAVEASAPPAVVVAETIPERLPPPSTATVEAAPEPPPLPRQPLRAMLTAFMEARNILWGELVGGLLIVGCSIALIVSLWPTLDRVPYSPFLILAAVTAALFGVGLYTLHHWKLESTSRGLLVIANLLVPLNFLVMARLHQTGSGTWLEASLALGGLVLFGALLRQAARVLVPEGGWFLPAGVLGCAAIELLAAWLVPAHPALTWVFLLGLATVACECVAVGGVLLRVRSRSGLEPAPACRLLLHLGIIAFAVLVTLGLLSYGARNLGAAGLLAMVLERLAVVVALAGIPVALSGLTVHTGLATRPEASGLRTAGTAVGLAGMIILLGGLALAWPGPGAVMAVGILDFAVLTTVAVRWRLPVIHALALPCLVLTCVTAVLVVWLNAGRETLPAALYSAESGVVLVAVMVVLAAVAEALARLRRHADALAYAACAGMAGALGLVLVSVPDRGTEAPVRALVLYGIAGVVGLALNYRWRRPLVSSLNVAVLVGATLWALFAVAGETARLPWWPTTLAVEGLGLAWFATLLGRRRADDSLTTWLITPLARSAEGLILLATGLALAAALLARSWSVAHALTGGSLCAGLLVLAVAEQRRNLARLAGLMLAGAAVALAGWLSVQVFHTAEKDVLACLALALAVCTAVQVGISLATLPGVRASNGTAPPWHTVLSVPWRDTAVVTGAAALVLCGVTWSNATPWLVALPFTFTAAAALVLTQREQQPGWTWLGSTFVLLGLARLSPARELADWFRSPDLALAFLGHATLALVAGAVWRQVRWRYDPPSADALDLPAEPSSLYRLFIGPLLHGSLVSSILGLVLILTAAWPTRLAAALCLVWLAVLWLCLARLRRSRPLFSGMQAVLCLAAVYGATAWLEGQPWYGEDIRTLHVYAIALALLSIAWVIVRLCKLPEGLAGLLSPPWPAVDRIVLDGLVLAQAGLAVLSILPAVTEELGAGGLHLHLPGAGSALPAGCFSATAWLLLSLLLLALALGLWERGAAAAMPGLLIVLLTAAVLGAGPSLGAHAASLALRWNLAGCFVVCSGLLLVRQRLVILADRLGWQIRDAGQLPALCRGILIVGAVLPILALSLATALARLAGGHPELPQAGTFFAALPWQVRLGLPLVLVSLGLLGHAIRERSLGYAFAAGLVVNFTLTTGQMLASTAWVYVFQANALAAALVGLLWLWLRSRLFGAARSRTQDSVLLSVQVAAPVVLAGILLSVAGGWLIVHPGQSWPAELLPIGEAGGWLAWLAALGAIAWYTADVQPRLLPHLLAGGVTGLGVLAAALAGRATSDAWVPYYILLGWWATASFGLLGVGWRLTAAHAPDGESADRFGIASAGRAWAMLLAASVAFLGLRMAWDDPARPYVSILAAVAASALFTLVALWRPRPAPVYVSGLLLNLAGLFAWFTWGSGQLDVAAEIQAFCFALAALVWCALEQSLQRARPLRADWPSFVHLAASLAVMLLTALVAFAVLTSLLGSHSWAGTPLAWIALGASAVACVALLLDPTAILAGAALYLVGILAMALGLHSADVGPRLFGWWTGLGLACYVPLTSTVAGWWQRQQWFPKPVDARSPRWFVPTQNMVAGLSILLSIWMSLDFASLAQRLAGPLAVALLLPAGIAAGNRQLRQGRRWMQQAVLLLGTLLAVEASWSLLDPAAYSLAGLLLRRSMAVMVALAVLTVLYGVVLSRQLLWTEWATAARRLGPVLGLIASAVLLGVLVQEAWLYRAGSAVPAVDPLGPLAIVIVLLVLIALFGAALAFAVHPDADPFRLSERGRMAYVYAAEALLALMFVHLRLTAPGLFRLGLFAAYWPLIVMGLAFLGAGLGEFFQRHGLLVLAEPLERTGIGLPLLPVLAFWLVPAPRYATVWFLAGLLYGLLSLTRRSFRFALLAALAANAGLWVLLHHHAIFLWQHPQLWLIPPALVLLVAEHLNRERLGHYQSMALRYVALAMVYVSSTADLFLAGLGQSWILPLVLILLCVLGILLGMLLRVRAFLFQGTAFLVLTIVLMIWHAGVDQRQAWILWSAGIVLGAAIVALFGVFEKRRDDVLHLVEQLKQWQ